MVEPTYDAAKRRYAKSSLTGYAGKRRTQERIDV